MFLPMSCHDDTLQRLQSMADANTGTGHARTHTQWSCFLVILIHKAYCVALLHAYLLLVHEASAALV